MDDSSKSKVLIICEDSLTCVGYGTLNYSEKKLNYSIYMYVCVPIMWIGL